MPVSLKALMNPVEGIWGPRQRSMKFALLIETDLLVLEVSWSSSSL